MRYNGIYGSPFVTLWTSNKKKKSDWSINWRVIITIAKKTRITYVYLFVFLINGTKHVCNASLKCSKLSVWAFKTHLILHHYDVNINDLPWTYVFYITEAEDKMKFYETNDWTLLTLIKYQFKSITIKPTMNFICINIGSDLIHYPY